MDHLGLNSDVWVGGRRFHVQTNYSLPLEKIICNVFDNGRVVTKRELTIAAGIPPEQIRQRLDFLHKETIADLELLFYISDKVKTIQHPVSNNKLGLIFLKKNLIQEAIEEFGRAIALDPKYAEAYKNLGRALMAQDKLEEAMQVVLQGVAQAPTYADLRNTLGCLYVKQGRYGNALQEFQEALKLNPEYAEAHLNLGIAWLRSALEEESDSQLPPVEVRQKRGIEHLARAVDLDPSLRTPKFEKAFDRIRRLEFSEAVEELGAMPEGVTPKEDFEFEHEFYLKFMFGGKGKDDALITRYVERLKAAMEQHPDYADLHNNLGVAYLIQCRNLFLKALEEFRTALKINPSFQRAEKNLKLAENDGKGFLILLRALLK